jgi:hypothetical protein
MPSEGFFRKRNDERRIKIAVLLILTSLLGRMRRVAVLQVHGNPFQIPRNGLTLLSAFAGDAPGEFPLSPSQETSKPIQEWSNTMSDFPIQTTSLNELKGGQRPLVSDDRRGNEHASQVFPLTGRPGTQVDNDVHASTVSPNNANGAATRDKGDVSGMNVGYGRSVVARPVDARNIEGSFKGDTRCKPGDVAKGSLHQAAEGQGGPRSSAGQFPNGRADTAGKGGSFGNEHANRSYPEVDAGD